MNGKHLLGYWAKTQQTVSLSSCEAEINGLVKCGVEGLGLRNLVRHCGVQVGLKLLTDASAAVGVCRRQGAGKQKHLSIKQLWTQGQEARGELSIAKIPRDVNVADLFTHHATRVDLEKFLAAMHVRRTRHCGRDGEEASRQIAAKISHIYEMFNVHSFSRYHRHNGDVDIHRGCEWWFPPGGSVHTIVH